MPEDAPFSYDQVPYEGHAFPQTHPDRLAVVGRLMGLNPPDVARARVLELGCASAENLVPMAYTMPDASFVGVDLSRHQIAAGQKMIDRLGLDNLRIFQGDILDLGPDLGTFDYIICHGVFSWVPRAVQDKILDLCATLLAPDGMAIISYNVLPGWHHRRMAREMMRYHATQFDEPQQRVAQARSILSFVAECNTFQDQPYGQWLRYMDDFIKGERDHYIYHEYLEDINEPMYFYQFCERIAEHGLQYVGDSALHSAMPPKVAPKVSETLGNIATDHVRFEQYLDFLRQRTFRHSIVTRAAVPPDRKPRVSAMAGLYIVADLPLKITTERHDGDATDDTTMGFCDANGLAMSTNNPVAKSALCMLLDNAPRAYTIEELHAGVCRKLAARAAELDTLLATPEPLAGFILLFVWSGALFAQTQPPRYVPTISERPRVSAVTRATVGLWPLIPTLRHRAMDVPAAPVPELLKLLDGTRTEDELVAALSTGEPTEDLRRRVRESLAMCARTCLLEA